jgi:hypothetical protein
MDPRYVLYFAVALVVIGIAVHILLWWMFHAFESRQARGETQQILVETPEPPREPRLQVSPQGDLQELRRQEDEALSTYSWIDRASGTARVPIDRAMQLYLERQKK